MSLEFKYIFLPQSIKTLLRTKL